MKRYVSLLRGINVGSSKRIKKEALEKLYAGLGYTDVLVVIQSGNVIFSARSGTAAAHARRITEAFAEELGFDVPAVVLGVKELAAIMRKQPFAKEAKKDPAKVFIGFHAEKATVAAVRQLNAREAAPNSFKSSPQATYIHCPEGIGRAKLPNFEKMLGVPVTVRNSRVLADLLERLTGKTQLGAE